MSEDKYIYSDPMSCEVIGNYKLLDKLAAGTYDVIYKANNTATDELCAVKVIDLGKCSQRIKEKFLPRELAALIGVKHDNVIRIYHIYKSNHKIYIFMELASNGDIYCYLTRNGAMSEPAACRWFHQVMDALRFIHEELKIAHRDIKIDNILLNDKMNAKLTDFGFAKYTVDENTGEVLMSETYCGTEPYYSPQIVARVPYNPFCADVWAMGVVLFAMLNNKFLFHFGDRRAMLNEQNDWPNYIRRQRFVNQFSQDCNDLNEKMLDPQESQRITVRQILSHSWVIRRGE